MLKVNFVLNGIETQLVVNAELGNYFLFEVRNETLNE